MIVRPEQHWLKLLFSWRGSVMKKILPKLFLFSMLHALYLFIISLRHMHGVIAKKIKLPSLVFLFRYFLVSATM